MLRYSEKLRFPLWGTTVRSHTLGAPRFDRKRVRSRRVGHSVTGMLRIPVLSNGTCNVEHIWQRHVTLLLRLDSATNL